MIVASLEMAVEESGADLAAWPVASAADLAVSAADAAA
jgi:hypothetical protein